MGYRAEQLASVLKRALQKIMDEELNDPRVKGHITVSRVKVDTDLTYARIFVSVTPESAETVTMNGLHAANAFIRRRLMSEVELRRMPKLDFRMDVSLKKEQQVLTAIARAMAELSPDKDSQSEDNPDTHDSGSAAADVGETEECSDEPFPADSDQM